MLGAPLPNVESGKVDAIRVTISWPSSEPRAPDPRCTRPMLMPLASFYLLV